MFGTHFSYSTISNDHACSGYVSESLASKVCTVFGTVTNLSRRGYSDSHFILCIWPFIAGPFGVGECGSQESNVTNAASIIGLYTPLEKSGDAYNSSQVW